MKKWILLSLLMVPVLAFCDPQVVIVTGASKGIGKAICENLASKGHIVYGTMRSPDSFDGFENTSIIIKQLDVTNLEQMSAVISEVIEEQNRIDVLVNNAGDLVISPCEMFTLNEAKEQFEVNFFGAFSMMQGVLPQMRNQKSGRIINISSTSGFDPAIGLDMYSASKCALEALSESMASYLPHFGVDISVIQSGPVKTDFALYSKAGTKTLDVNPYEKFQEHLLKWYHGRLKQGQDPAEIAELVDKIILQEKPRFRYQSNLNAVKRAQKSFVDISGHDSITPKQVFSNELFERPIDSSKAW